MSQHFDILLGKIKKTLPSWLEAKHLNDKAIKEANERLSQTHAEKGGTLKVSHLYNSLDDASVRFNIEHRTVIGISTTSLNNSLHVKGVGTETIVEAVKSTIDTYLATTMANLTRGTPFFNFSFEENDSFFNTFFNRGSSSIPQYRPNTTRVGLEDRLAEIESRPEVDTKLVQLYKERKYAKLYRSLRRLTLIFHSDRNGNDPKFFQEVLMPVMKEVENLK